MNAKDTVIKVPDHSESVWCPHCGEEFGIEAAIDFAHAVQAEVSFKAGILEVVKYIEHNKFHVDGFPCYNAQSWQAKLKEWRINDD